MNKYQQIYPPIDDFDVEFVCYPLVYVVSSRVLQLSLTV